MKNEMSKNQYILRGKTEDNLKSHLGTIAQQI